MPAAAFIGHIFQHIIMLLIVTDKQFLIKIAKLAFLGRNFMVSFEFSPLIKSKVI